MMVLLSPTSFLLLLFLPAIVTVIGRGGGKLMGVCGVRQSHFRGGTQTRSQVMLCYF